MDNIYDNWLTTNDDIRQDMFDMYCDNEDVDLDDLITTIHTESSSNLRKLINLNLRSM